MSPFESNTHSPSSPRRSHARMAPGRELSSGESEMCITTPDYCTSNRWQCSARNTEHSVVHTRPIRHECIGRAIQSTNHRAVCTRSIVQHGAWTNRSTSHRRARLVTRTIECATEWATWRHGVWLSMAPGGRCLTPVIARSDERVKCGRRVWPGTLHSID